MEDLKTPNFNVTKIKVIGIGGGGNNAVNRMITANITTAEFCSINTDKQALYLSQANKKIQIGQAITRGLGAGADPLIGQQAAEESKDEITEYLKDTDLLFITAGMGGGTGTGAAPVVASIARKMGILTIAIVTKPFSFEGSTRAANAEMGIRKRAEYVDTLLVIPNDKLRSILPKSVTLVEAFQVADDVLRQSIQGISDLISIPSMVNLDFADVKTIISNAGLAHIGFGLAEGEDRAIKAVRKAVASPLLETSIEGAKAAIISCQGGVDFTMNEAAEICDQIKEVLDDNANIIFGAGIDSHFGDKVSVTVIATRFGNAVSGTIQQEIPEVKPENEVRREPASVSYIEDEEESYSPPKQRAVENGRLNFDKLPPFIRALQRNKDK